MVRNSCPGDIDSALPMGDDDECDVLKTPSDPSMYRLQVVKNWLLSIESTMPMEAQKRLKVAIVPFTGGSVEEGRGDSAKMNFTDTVGARIFIDELATQQMKHLEFYVKGDSTATAPNFMGTSVPGTRINLLQGIVKTEIDLLKASDDLKNSNFQLVFISDGRPQPTSKDVKATMNRIWKYRTYALGPGQGIGGYEACIPLCSAYLDSVLSPASDVKLELPPTTYPPTLPTEYMGCTKECLGAIGTYYSDSQVSGYSTVSPQELISDIGLAWGEFSRNRPLDILQSIQKIRNMFFTNTEAKFNFHFEYINPSQSIAAVNPDDNWIRLARSIFKKNTTHKEITGPEQPRNFFPETQSSVSYQLKDFYVVNLNARIDKYGKLEVDNDGDGLFDYDEEADDRKTARSNGVCLDSINKKYGCLMKGCDANLDSDGDGLNECEEITLGTDPNDFDSDSDGIPDSLEILFDFDPLKNDRLLDSNNDGYTNLENYKAGLPNAVYFTEIKDAEKVKLSMEFSDYSKVTSGTQDLFMAGYVAQLLNLPVGNLLMAAPANDFDLFYSRSHVESTRISTPLVGGSHGLNENRILFLGYVQSITNPGDGYWIFQEKKLVYQTQSFQVLLDLNTFKPLFSKDPITEQP